MVPTPEADVSVPPLPPEIASEHVEDTNGVPLGLHLMVIIGTGAGVAFLIWIITLLVGGNVEGAFLIVLFVGLLVGLAVYARSGRGPNTARQPRYFAESPRECVEEATAYMVGNGFAVAQQSSATVTFTRPKKPSTDIGCLLLLLGIIPGLLYFGLFKGTYTTTLVARRGNVGTEMVVSGDDARGHRQLTEWARNALTPVEQA